MYIIYIYIILNIYGILKKKLPMSIKQNKLQYKSFSPFKNLLTQKTIKVTNLTKQ